MSLLIKFDKLIIFLGCYIIFIVEIEVWYDMDRSEVFK